MNEKVIEIPYKPHAKQILFHNSKARFKLLVAGRRSGKTVAGANEAIKHAIQMPGSKGLVCAPVYSQTDTCHNEIKKFLPGELIKNESRSNVNWHIKLINNSVIRFASLKLADNLKGKAFAWMWVDEIALTKLRDWEIVLRPMLMDTMGPAWFTTTPRLGTWVRELYVRGQTPIEQQKRVNTYFSLHYGTKDNPYISPEEVEDLARNISKQAYRQEILGEFIEDVGQIFSHIKPCYEKYTYSNYYEKEGNSMRFIVPNIDFDEVHYGGLDLAKHNDFTVFIILNKHGELVEFHRWNKIDWPLQRKKIRTIANKYSSLILTIDSRGVGDPTYDDLRAEGVRGLYPFNFNSFAQKKALIDALVVSIESGDVSFPNDPVLTNELIMFGFEKSNGDLSYNAPQGYHDDCVISLALANRRLRKSLRTIGSNLQSIVS